MGEDSKIEWTDHTFNPWTRCTAISPACDNCYAETWAGRATHPKDAAGKALPLWGADAPRAPTSAHNWKQPLRWNREAIEAGAPRFVFSGSLCDIGEDRPDLVAPRARLVKLIEATPGLVWLLLTKRPENLLRLFPEWSEGWPANVWPGTTVEDQQRADERVSHLLAVPSARRFLSVEPLLAPVHLALAGIAWVICGGESGQKARPMHPGWARSVRDQCQSAGVAFHFKQWGEWAPRERGDGQPFDTLAGHNRDRLLDHAGNVHCTYEAAGEGAFPMSRVGKKLAGRLLDGRLLDGRPDPLPVKAPVG
jgi:protein gp37